MTALMLLAMGSLDLTRTLTRPASNLRRWLPLVVAAVSVLLGWIVQMTTVHPGPWASALSLLLGMGALYSWFELAGPSRERTVGRVCMTGVVGLVALLEAALPSQTRAFAPAALTVLAVVMVLFETANRLTRDILVLAGRPSTEDAPAGLRGGRFIGPMERLLMMVLGLMAAYPVVAAIMAAKGIVRFPEISRSARRPHSGQDPEGDLAEEDSGSVAEEFLVGSLASWSLAAGAGVLVHLALNGV